MHTTRLDQDTGHPKATGVDVKGTDTHNPVEQISAQIKTVLELAQGNGEDDFEKLVDLYMGADSFIDEGIKLSISAKMKEKLAELKQRVDGGEKIAKFSTSWHSEEPEIYGRDPVLSKLLRLEQDSINSDGCVTDILYSACRDWDTAMWLWGRFTSPYGHGDVNPKSNEFLRKHLETYGGDEKKLWDAHKKFNRGSRRARFIAEYIGEMRHDAKLERLGQTKGDYDSLAQLGSEDIGEEFCAAMDEILPTMVEECGGDLEKLVALYKNQYCSRPLVRESVKTALLPEVAKCGDDFDKLAELRAKAPANLRNIIDEAATSMCKKDPNKIMALTKSSLARSLSKFIVFNADALVSDFDVLKSLLALEVEDDKIASSLLTVRVSGLLAKFIEAHKTDLDKLLVLAETVKGTDYKKQDKYPEIDEAIAGALLFAVQQCGGDLVKLCEIHEKMPEALHDDVVTAVRKSIKDYSPDLLMAQAENDLVGLQKLCDKMPYHLGAAVQPLIDEAVKKMAAAKAEECAGDFQKLLELYERIPPTIEFHHGEGEGLTHHFNIEDVAQEAIAVYIQNLLPDLIAQCGGDLKKLDDLYEKILFELQEAECGRIVVDAVEPIFQSLVEEHKDDLDAFIAVCDSFHCSLGQRLIKGDGEVRSHVEKLFVEAMAQCGDDIDALEQLQSKVPYIFKDHFVSILKDLLPVIMQKCSGDFGKLAKLYGMVPPECQAGMVSRVKVQQ